MSLKVNPEKREDISKFLVHLTRDYNDISAMDNLINIISSSIIKATNPHCLFKHNFKKLGFSQLLMKKFNVVCLTEIPLHQIKVITQNIPGRQVKLKPYGIVFWKSNLLESGASPAIYVNAKGTGLREFLLEEFKRQFANTANYRDLRVEEKEYYKEIIQYYSLINVVNYNHDFMWEREWRFNGDLRFTEENIVAIIAEDQSSFIARCEEKLSKKKINFIKKTPIISPAWNYEEIIEAMSIAIWNSHI